MIIDDDKLSIRFSMIVNNFDDKFLMEETVLASSQKTIKGIIRKAIDYRRDDIADYFRGALLQNTHRKSKEQG